MNYLSITSGLILWIGWLLLLGGTVYILVKGKSVLRSVEGSIIGKLAKGLMIGFFVESYSIIVLLTVLLYASEQNIYVVLPIFLVWLITFIYTWRVMRKTRQYTEKIAGK